MDVVVKDLFPLVMDEVMDMKGERRVFEEECS